MNKQGVRLISAVSRNVRVNVYFNIIINKENPLAERQTSPWEKLYHFLDFRLYRQYCNLIECMKNILFVRMYESTENGASSLLSAVI